MKILLKIISVIGAVLTGVLVFFLSVISGLNFFIYVLSGGNESVVFIIVLTIFLILTFLVFRVLDKLLQKKFLTK